MGRIGNAPGLVYEQANVAPKSRTPHREIGYGYRVTFDVEGAAETPGTELFRSPDAVFYLSDPIRGMLGFARDGFKHIQLQYPTGPTFKYRYRRR